MANLFYQFGCLGIEILVCASLRVFQRICKTWRVYFSEGRYTKCSWIIWNWLITADFCIVSKEFLFSDTAKIDECMSLNVLFYYNIFLHNQLTKNDVNKYIFKTL